MKKNFLSAIFSVCLIIILSLSIFGCSGGGGGSGSTVVNSVAKPAAPDPVTAVPSAGQIALNWNTVPNADTYNVYHSKAPGAKASGTKLAGCTSPFVLPELIPGKTYYFVVTSENSAGESEVFKEISATVPSITITGNSIIESVMAGEKTFFVGTNDETGDLALFDSAGNPEKILAGAGTFSFRGAAYTNGIIYVGVDFADVSTMTQKVFVFAFSASTGKKIPEATRTYAALSGVVADQAAGILYIIGVKDASGITWIDAINVTTGEVVASRGDSPGDPTYGAFDGGKYFVQDGVLHVLGRILPNQGGNDKVKVFRFKDVLATELPSFVYISSDPKVVNDVDSGNGFALSPDGQTMVVSETINLFSGPKNALVKFNVATQAIISVTEIPTTAIDLTFDNAGSLYCIINNNLIKIDIATMAQKVLKSGVSHLTLDKATETIYAASGSDVFPLNLDGSSK